eukprot:Phypoly_transcript_11950.p1 GENE.Phypoly_transcript_11950~~Phypoly_transcript_11950.p1  ORF type:complete len:311 (+),score=33.69 Phypoly_transcript_11950:106-1038(+)
MTQVKPLTETDLWILRAGVVVFGIYCAQFTLYPIFKKVVLEKSMSMLVLISKHSRFLVLVLVGMGVLVIYPFYDLIPKNEYYSSSSFFIGLFTLSETYISYYRVPFKILSPIRGKVVRVTVICEVAIGLFRTIVDLVISIVLITGPWNQPVQDFYVFCKILRMVAAFAFTVSELCIAKVTLDLISTPRSVLTPEVRIQIKTTKSKLEALATANSTGAVTAFVDIFNHWFEIQMLHAFVVVIGAVTFIFYGRLFNLGLEDKADMETLKARASVVLGVQSQQTYTYSKDSDSPTPSPVLPPSIALSAAEQTV